MVIPSRRLIPPAPLLDFVTAAAIACLTELLLRRSGGVWDHVGGADLHGIFISKYEYGARAIRELRLPLWNRTEFCGAPLLATAQAALLYPPVIWWFNVLPPKQALSFLNGTHVLIFAWATIAYLRRHRIPRLGGAFATFVALGALCTAPGGAIFDHPNYIATVAWCPAVLVCWEKSLRGGGRWVIACGFASAMQWLAGYPDFVLDTAIFLGLAAALSDEAPIARRFAYVVVALLIGVGLAAVQLIPLAESVRESLRVENQQRFEFLRTLAALNSPDAIWDEVKRYGWSAGALGLVAIIFDWSRSRATWLVCFVWALFALNYPFSWLYGVPPFSAVRLPLGWRYLAAFFLGALAAAGLHRLWTTRSSTSRARALGARGLAIVLGAAAIRYGAECITTYPASLPDPAPDYGLMTRRAVVLSSLRNLFGASARVVAYPETAGGFALRYDLPSPHGYEPALAPKRIAHLLTPLKLYGLPTADAGAASIAIAAKPHLASLLGIGLVAVPRTLAGVLLPAGFTRVADIPPRDVVLYRRPVPRISLAHRATIVGSEQKSLDAVLARKAGEEDNIVVIIPPGEAMPRLEARDGQEEVRLVADEAERVVVRATVSASAMLVLRDAFYPGWRARVDGTAAPVVEVDHAFRGVPLDSGNHVVEFDYAPTSLKLGASASGLTLLVIVLMWVRWLCHPLPRSATMSAAGSRG